MSDEMAELEAKHAKEREELKRKLEIRAELYDVGVPWRIHVYQLYGAVAGVQIGYPWFDYSGKDPKPTLDTVRLAAEHHPPEPMVMVRDGCLSFRSKAHVEALPEEKKARWEEERNVAPFLVEANAFQRQSASFEWYTRLKSGTLVRMEIELPLMRELGAYSIRRRGPEHLHDALPIESCTFTPDAARLTTLFHGPEPVAQLEHPIRWASGSPSTPNKFTLYWLALRDDMTPTVGALVDALMKKAT